MFRACAPRPAVRVLYLVAVALLVTGAVLIAVYAPRPERGAIGAVTLVSFAITAPWAVWCSRLLLLRMEAQAWRMPALPAAIPVRSDEHTSELQSLMRISYAVFCLKKNNRYH